ncbi:hypothetical protein M2480_002859 [Parabacteroides sp. PFB2-12]|nr:hypothetical protein [Parabacteroides sp. PM6-13]MDH6391857.1 hypothetical protein [Parabacteroides sp. PFB2-12]
MLSMHIALSVNRPDWGLRWTIGRVGVKRYFDLYFTYWVIVKLIAKTPFCFTI